MNHYQIIDEEKWERKMHCAIFRNYVEPEFCVTLELDITKFLQMVKSRGYSFTLAMTYFVAKHANEVEAFRYRFQDGKVVLFDQIDTSFTYLNENTGLFKVICAPMTEDMDKYIKQTKEIIDKQTAYFTGPMGNDIFQFSAMPWVKYTHISHTNSGKRDNATPLFDWGKFYEKDGKTWMPFSVQAHHSFVDGIHVGQLIEKLQQELNSF